MIMPVLLTLKLLPTMTATACLHRGRGVKIGKSVYIESTMLKRIRVELDFKHFEKNFG